MALPNKYFPAGLGCLTWLVLFLAVGSSKAQLVTVHAFVRPPQNPGGGILGQASDGYLWGGAMEGGDFNAGAIYRVKPDGTDWQIVVSFSGTAGPNRGQNPASGLTRGLDGNFYGITSYGGANNRGTIFKITPAGVLTTMLDFTGGGVSGNGDTPVGALLQLANGDFYGTTKYGGAHGAGIVFRFSSNVIQTVVEFDFNGTQNRGAYPLAGLVLAENGMLYGTTSEGGSSGAGTVFQLTVAGAITTLLDFTYNGANNRGANPAASLVQGNDQLLYGVTKNGGSGGSGTVFKVTTAGVLTTLADFTGGDPIHGLNPIASLLKVADGSFIGATTFGGSFNAGTIFHVTSAGALTTTIEFTGSSGANRGSAAGTGLLIASDGNYYGATTYGGLHNVGTVYRLTPGGVLNPVTDFVPLNADERGATPYGGLVNGPDGFLYGMTTGGGTLLVGTVFKIGPDGSLTTLVEFTGNSGPNRGANPYGGLTWDNNGFFYGATSRGGVNDDGTVFKMTTGGVLTTLVDFQFNGATNKGAQPYGNLVLAADGNFYGVTISGGLNGMGTIFRLAPAGILTTVVNFSGASGISRGAIPYAGLFLGAGGVMYGTTSQGGTNGTGTAYSITTGGVISTLNDFSSGGVAPIGGLVLGNDNFLYGTTAVGGANDVGTIFRMTTGGALASLVSFTGDVGSFRGSSPYATLAKDGAGNFYGATYFGGAAKTGTIFRLSSGGTFTSLVELTGSGPQANSGAAPAYGPPIIGPSGNLYGTTSAGGPHGAGSIYRINLVTVAPRIIAFSPASGNTIINAVGVAGVTYFLEATDDLTSVWNVVSTAVIADGTGALQFIDARAALPAQRFYRVISGP